MSSASKTALRTSSVEERYILKALLHTINPSPQGPLSIIECLGAPFKASTIVIISYMTEMYSIVALRAEFKLRAASLDKIVLV